VEVETMLGESLEPEVVASAPTRTLRRFFTDVLVVAERNLISYVRVPETLYFSSIQPIMFVLLFRYVFGGAIAVPGRSYVDFLIPGIFVQTVAFGSIGTAVGLAEDLRKGFIERFRSLPMARSAVLAGRTVADLCRNILVVVIITVVGTLVGFRIHTSPLAFLGAVGVLLLFAYALSWGFSVVGMIAPNAEAAQLMAFPLLFPLTFASSAFVPVQSMPSWLQGFANNQPISVIVDAVRVLALGGPTADIVLKAIVWSLGILAVVAPLSVRRFRRMV
jgi:ABC-2 type transport system permease protein/oleandomycin transport system permease protein